MPKMQDMLPWHLAYLRYKMPELKDAGVHGLFQEFKKTNFKSKEAMAFFAGWTGFAALANYRVDDLLEMLQFGRAKDV